MPKDKELQKKKQKQEFGKILGQKEVDSYEKHLFDVDKYGGSQEAEALIQKYEKKITLSENDKRILRNNVPPAPAFDVMRKEQYDKKGCWKKKKYRQKVKEYYESREKYYTSKDKTKEGKLSKGMLFAQKRAELEERFATAGLISGKTEQKEEELFKPDDPGTLEQALEDLKKTEEKYKDVEGLFDEIDDDMYSIDEAYQNRRDNPEVIKAEEEIGRKQCEVHMSTHRSFDHVVKRYCFSEYNSINKKLRKGGNIDSSVESAINVMKMHKTNRDMVVRRGVKNLNTIAFMMGLNNAGEINSEDLKSMLKEKFESGEKIIVSEKGFMSTALPHAKKNFDAGSTNLGIEFMILLKKGTSAVNVSSRSAFKEEEEILLAPGTKFEIVDMQLDGDAEIYHGNKKSWKIYLKTIPDSKEGIRKEAA